MAVGPLAQLARAPPLQGGGHPFEPDTAQFFVICTVVPAGADPMKRTMFEALEPRCLFAVVPAAEHVFLIGNSMTDAIRYGGLVALLGRDGRAVTLGRQTGPGYSIADNPNLKPGHY